MTNELGNFPLKEWNQKTMGLKDWRHVNLDSCFFSIGHVFFSAGFGKVEFAFIKWLFDAELGKVFTLFVLCWSFTGSMSFRVHQETLEFISLICEAVSLEVVSA